MHILAIPDVHQDVHFLQRIFDTENIAAFDKVIFLGDYFDTRVYELDCDEAVVETARFIKEIKLTYPDKVHLLCGNHDLPYYAMRPMCAANTGRVNSTIADWFYDGNSYHNANLIEEIWGEEIWSTLEVAVTYDGWIFSHAGIHPNYWPADGDTPEEKVNILRKQWDEAIARIFQEEENIIFGTGKARGGEYEAGGPLWLDFDLEFEDALEYPQVVGHTKHAIHHKKGRSHCIDYGQNTYAVVQHGDILLKVTKQLTH